MADMTYSIVARDPATGELGVGIQSKFFAAGSIVGWAKAGVGAVATQALANRMYGPDGLELLADGLDPAEIADRLTSVDDDRAQRQLGIVDARGRSTTWTGDECIPWAGGRTAKNVAVQGNICAGPRVADAMLETFQAGGAPLAELLVHCLSEAESAGGDRRGRQAAGLLVVREPGPDGGPGDDPLDLRVDDHSSPIHELARLLDLDRLYRDRSKPEDLVPIDEPLAAEIRHLIEAFDAQPGNPAARSVPELTDRTLLARASIVITGEPRGFPAGWDSNWQGALEAWMGVENLMGRFAAPGWIDPRVLDFLRSQGLTDRRSGPKG